jgi:pyruvate kinase
VSLANSLPNSKIVIFTRRGNMANYVSNLRPHAPIYAFSPTYEVCRKLVINWGTHPRYLPFDPNPGRTIGSAIKTLMDEGLARRGDHLVIVSDMLAGEERFDTIQLRVIGESETEYNP